MLVNVKTFLKVFFSNIDFHSYLRSYILCDIQEGIYYKWASVKMTLKFHFLWSTLF